MTIFLSIIGRTKRRTVDASSVEPRANLVSNASEYSAFSYPHKSRTIESVEINTMYRQNYTCIQTSAQSDISHNHQLIH